VFLEPVSRLNVWVLDGDVSHSNLLKFALNGSTIQHSMVVIAIDLSSPWDLVESLTRWLKVLQQHLEQLYNTLPKEYVQQLKRNSKKQK
jgi:dynein light intermediate chain 1